MRIRLTPRDRALLLYVLWPVALFAAVMWGVVPLARALATGRGELAQQQADLRMLRAAIARGGDVEAEHARLRAEHEQLRRWVLSKEASVDAVVALQRLLQETGHSLRSLRVERVEPLRGDARTGVRLTTVPIEASVTGTYPGLVASLRRWTAQTVPLKLTRLEATRDDGTGELRTRLLLRAFLQPAPPQKRL